jgi:hypothetical protein
MSMRSFVAVGIVGLASVVVACSASTEDATVQPAPASLDPAAKNGGNKAVQLNLSHIECTPEGTVNAHFVLLFFGTSYPGPISGTYFDGTSVNPFPDTIPTKSTGNVWHYNVTLPAGYVDILTASAGGATLHNPGEYAGTYANGCTPPPVCDVQVQDIALYCTDKPLGNEEAECDAFGLDPFAKYELGGSATSVGAHTSALLAIVKTGSGACGSGEASYQIFANVSAGDPLSTPTYLGPNGQPKQQGISHVTYCQCPDPE